MTLIQLPHIELTLPDPTRFASIEPIQPESPVARNMIHEVWDLDQKLKAALDPELRRRRKETTR